MPVGLKARAPCSAISLLLHFCGFQASVLVHRDSDHPLDPQCDDSCIAEADRAVLKQAIFIARFSSVPDTQVWIPSWRQKRQLNIGTKWHCLWCKYISKQNGGVRTFSAIFSFWVTLNQRILALRLAGLHCAAPAQNFSQAWWLN